MTDYASLHACYVSGQMSERDWQDHLSRDSGLKSWVDEQNTIRPPLTLEDVTHQINDICDEYVTAVRRTKESFERNLDALGQAVDASPDIDQNAVGSIIMGRVNQMMRDAAEVIAE